MEPKTVIYQEKSTCSWVAEIIDLDAFPVGKQLWRGVYGSKEVAQREAQIITAKGWRSLLAKSE